MYPPAMEIGTKRSVWVALEEPGEGGRSPVFDAQLADAAGSE